MDMPYYQVFTQWEARFPSSRLHHASRAGEMVLGTASSGERLWMKLLTVATRFWLYAHNNCLYDVPLSLIFRRHAPVLPLLEV